MANLFNSNRCETGSYCVFLIYSTYLNGRIAERWGERQRQRTSICWLIPKWVRVKPGAFSGSPKHLGHPLLCHAVDSMELDWK